MGNKWSKIVQVARRLEKIQRWFEEIRIIPRLYENSLNAITITWGRKIEEKNWKWKRKRDKSNVRKVSTRSWSIKEVRRERKTKNV